MRGVGGVRKSIHQSWLAKGLGLQCWGFKGVQEEIPWEDKQQHPLWKQTRRAQQFRLHFGPRVDQPRLPRTIPQIKAWHFKFTRFSLSSLPSLLSTTLFIKSLWKRKIHQPRNKRMQQNSAKKSTRLNTTGWGKLIHWELCKKLKFCQTTKLYMHKPEPVLKNEMHKILRNFEIQIDFLISAR